jgi:hypothetical protein
MGSRGLVAVDLAGYSGGYVFRRVDALRGQSEPATRLAVNHKVTPYLRGFRPRPLIALFKILEIRHFGGPGPGKLEPKSEKFDLDSSCHSCRRDCRNYTVCHFCDEAAGSVPAQTPIALFRSKGITGKKLHPGSVVAPRTRRPFLTLQIEFGAELAVNWR